MEDKRKNPFRKLFLGIAAICCIALSGVFYYIGYMNNKEEQKKNAYSKAEMIMTDFERQLKTMKEVSLEIASDYEFHPYYFKKNISRELSMLNKLEKFGGYLALSDEYFLYYGGDRIYRSLGTSIDLELLLRDKTENEEDFWHFRNELEEICKKADETKLQQSVMAVSGNIYVFTPLRVRENSQQTLAVLIYEVKAADLGNRFQLVSGGMEGNIAVFEEGEMIYSDDYDMDWITRSDVLKTDSMDMRYTLCYLPGKESYWQSAVFLYQIILILIDIVFIYFIANAFAERAYKPLSILTNEYRGKTRNYILQRLLESSGMFGNQQDLENAAIHLPGPFYCVLSIAFKEEMCVTKELADHLQEALEQITNDNEQTYIYTFYNVKKKVINVICSFQKENQDNMFDMICEVADSFGYESYIGRGNIYVSLSNLSASWMESMDNIYSDIVNEKQVYIYDQEELHKISAALGHGDEKAAKESLRRFLDKTGKIQLSLLMQQYIIADFLGEMKGLSERYGLKLSKKNVSLLLSSRNMQDFENAASGLIDEIIESYNFVKHKMADDKSREIYQYINTHFNDYDISIENIADNLHTSPKNVRNTVVKYTGKMYKEYLIHLRLEYAKELLKEESLPVSEVCYKVGYSNISYFVKLFREVTGVTPAKYRENNINE